LCMYWLSDMHKYTTFSPQAAGNYTPKKIKPAPKTQIFLISIPVSPSIYLSLLNKRAEAALHDI
jgi:hypothetical protein